MYDFFDFKSRMSGEELKKPSFLLVGYKFISLLNNMGIIFWFVAIFIVSLVIKLSLFIFRSKVEKLTEGSKLLKYIRIHQNFSERL